MSPTDPSDPQGPPAKRRISSGTAIALTFLIVIAASLVLLVAYKLHESGLPPATATFTHLAQAPANATVHDLAFTDVHARDSFLEDHLNTALQQGSSRETSRLRVEQMRATVSDLVGVPDATLVVRWDGELVQVAFSGLP